MHAGVGIDLTMAYGQVLLVRPDNKPRLTLNIQYYCNPFQEWDDSRFRQGRWNARVGQRYENARRGCTNYSKWGDFVNVRKNELFILLLAICPIRIISCSDIIIENYYRKRIGYYPPF